MVYRVVSTKLTEDEHSSLMDKCNRQGCSPSLFIKTAILEKVNSTDKEKQVELEILEALESKDEGGESIDRPFPSKSRPESELIKFMRLCRAQREKNRDETET